MRPGTRKVLDRAFTGVGIFSIALVSLALLVLLGPIVIRGAGAFVFQGTIAHRRAQLELFEVGKPAAVAAEWAQVQAARKPVYEALDAFEAELADYPYAERRRYRESLAEFKEGLRKLLGPLPEDLEPVQERTVTGEIVWSTSESSIPRKRFGPTRWDRALVEQHHLLHVEQWDYSDPTKMGTKVYVPRVTEFAGTALEPAFAMIENDLEALLRPQWTFYWRFLLQPSTDAHFFGGIWAEVLGTLYLTIGAVLFAVPMGVISAIYLVEYARDTWAVRMLRSCVSTLAGVPSIVFGLFGLAFFINTIGVSDGRSVIAGALTLAVLILPVVIRAAEEAIKAVPATYKEAALSVGAGKWHTILTVILPAALPGILTGVVISMGRAAGETAPIIFTAAWSASAPIALWQTLDRGTPALPWNVYNLCTEHEAVDEIRHVQYGMVLTLVALVLLLNGVAIIMRARIARKLTG
jgi:phosphate transport system permease protein